MGPITDAGVLNGLAFRNLTRGTSSGSPPTEWMILGATIIIVLPGLVGLAFLLMFVADHEVKLLVAPLISAFAVGYGIYSVRRTIARRDALRRLADALKAG